MLPTKHKSGLVRRRTVDASEADVRAGINRYPSRCKIARRSPGLREGENFSRSKHLARSRKPSNFVVYSHRVRSKKTTQLSTNYLAVERKTPLRSVCFVHC